MVHGTVEVDECFYAEKWEEEEEGERFTRQIFREHMKNLVHQMILREDFDRERYEILYKLLQEKKSYDTYVRSTRETYFIDSVALMENGIRRAFHQPMWHFVFCNRDHTCHCFMN